MVISCVLTVFQSKKSIFKESSFHNLGQYFFTLPSVNKHFDTGAKWTANKLWKDKASYKRAIMKQLGLSTATLLRVEVDYTYYKCVQTVCESRYYFWFQDLSVYKCCLYSQHIQTKL
jgi:hypothetical protein